MWMDRRSADQIGTALALQSHLQSQCWSATIVLLNNSRRLDYLGFGFFLGTDSARALVGRPGKTRHNWPRATGPVVCSQIDDFAEAFPQSCYQIGIEAFILSMK